MSDPVPYAKAYSFSGFQANNPSTPLPAPKLDDELSNIEEAIEGLVNAVKDVRSSDGRLRNGSVAFETLSLGLQLTFDPTNGELVAAAVETAQAAATASEGFKNTTSGLAVAAAASAAAAAASASEVNLANYLPKAGNLADLGNNDNALTNIGAAKFDGSNMQGRLGLTPLAVADFNDAVANGWYSGFNAANGPALGDWLVQVNIGLSSNYVTQIAYSYAASTTSTNGVRIYRRHSYNNGGVRTWLAWETMSPLAVGQTIYVSGTTAPPGTVKENGALLNRADFPTLWRFAQASGNIVTEAQWATSNAGAFSTGDLATTFRIPDARGEFIRGLDDGRGADPSRSIALNQASMIKDHKHASGTFGGSTAGDSGSINFLNANTSFTTGFVSSPDGGGTETRPRNIAKLACLVY